MADDKPKLTPRQQQIFELIQRSIARTGAMRLPRRQVEHGQGATPAPVRAKRSISAASTSGAMAATMERVSSS
mgnify:CR=1 FL=1